MNLGVMQQTEQKCAADTVNTPNVSHPALVSAFAHCTDILEGTNLKPNVLLNR